MLSKRKTAMIFQSYTEAADAVTRFIQSGDGDFNTLALTLFHLQTKHVPILKSVCTSKKIVPEQLKDWRQIPAIPTEAFQEYAVTSIPQSERTTHFQSSGTASQRPSRHWHHAASLHLYETSLRAPFQKHVLENRSWAGLTLALLPRPEDAPHSSLVHMAQATLKSDTVFAGQTCPNGWQIDSDMCHKTCQAAIHQDKPLLVIGPAFAFLHWLDHSPHSYRLPIGSRLMETGGYKGRTRELPKADLHHLLSMRTSVPETRIICEYGMCELSSQAYDRIAGTDHSRVFRFPHWARHAIINPETGTPCAPNETGLLRVFDLSNTFSSIGIQTQDLARPVEDGFELQGRAQVAEPRGCSLNLIN